jgi:hypothetical protein
MPSKGRMEKPLVFQERRGDEEREGERTLEQILRVQVRSLL